MEELHIQSLKPLCPKMSEARHQGNIAGRDAPNPDADEPN
jgi:hypothetical protein